MEKYAELCVEELSEIPFLKKTAEGKYETFDCRDFKGSGGELEGVQGALVPQTVSNRNGRQIDAHEVRRQEEPASLQLLSKCDNPEWLFQSCEPGPPCRPRRTTRARTGRCSVN
ncbi:MAG: hypothetical protein QM760_02390, partial [Nibricoccus sp.]